MRRAGARAGTRLHLSTRLAAVFDSVQDPQYADTGSLTAAGNVYRNTTGRARNRGSGVLRPAQVLRLHAARGDQARSAAGRMRRTAGRTLARVTSARGDQAGRGPLAANSATSG